MYLGTSEIFNNPTEVSSDLTATQFAPDGLQNQQSYYWLIVAENSEGTTRSAGRSFTTVIAAPDAPTSLSPANGHLRSSNSITLRWDSAPRGLTIDTTPPKRPVISKTPDPPGPIPPILQPPAHESCSSPFTGSISKSGEYVFEVRAVDRAGNKSQPRAHVFQVVTLLF